MALPMLLYGTEIWILTCYTKRGIKMVEMRLQRLLTIFWLLDHKKNQEIKDQLKVVGVIIKIRQSEGNTNHHCSREVISLPLIQQARVQILVGSVYWLKFFLAFFLNCKKNVKKFRLHLLSIYGQQHSLASDVIHGHH